MRDYSKIDGYLDKLALDIYEQPPDNFQNECINWLVDNWFTYNDRSYLDEEKNIINYKLDFGNRTMLDVGCGQGMSAHFFSRVNWKWSGVTLGNDYNTCKSKELDVYQDDFHFMKFKDNSFDLILSRHSLEHSPMPILALMDWRRISKRYLCVVLPNPDGYGGNKDIAISYRGKNHLSVMPKEQFLWLANRAGWQLLEENIIDFEMRFLLEKGDEVLE